MYHTLKGPSQRTAPLLFNMPTFNLDVTIYPGYGVGPLPPPAGTPSFPTPGQLKVYFNTAAGGFFVTSLGLLFLKVPRGTDLRANRPGGLQDLVEAPTASGRFYSCRYATEVARGFPNEYVVGLLQDLSPR